jgi:hypothetical protein
MGVRNFDISYSVPRKVVETLRMSSARIYLTGLNPINLYNPFDYKDPEGAYDVYPNLKTFSLGVNLTL